MFVKTLISTVALLAVVNAIKVTSPDEDTEWSTSGAHTVTWEAVSTDAESFQIVLDNQSGFLSNAPVVLISEQSTGAANTQNSASVTYPGGDWPTGYGFQINFISTSRNNNAIYAQSQQFNITSSGGMAGSSTSATSASSSSSSTTTMMMTTPTTMTRSTSSGTSATSAGAGDASGGIPGASTSSGNSASNIALPAIPFLGALAAFFL